jgi:putative PEP-CTERM system TPR-repeat lipoprotein
MNSDFIGKLSKVTLLVAIIALPIVSGCDRIGGSTPQQHIQKAKDSQSKGDLRASIIELKNALQKSPDNAEARLLLGEIYVKTQQGQNAEKELVLAQKLGGDKESIKVLLGQALLMQELYDRVLKEITPSSGVSPMNIAKIQLLHGEAQLGLGHMEQGCDLLKQSSQNDSAYIPTYWGLARCAAAKNDFDQAKALLDQALKLDANNTSTWMWLGKLAQARNDPKAAEVAYASVLKIAPDHVDAHLSLALLHLSADKFDAAQTEIAAARKMEPGNLRTKYLQAVLDFRQTKYASARDNLQEVLQKAPNHMPSIQLFGMVAYQLGNYEQAAQNLTKALNEFPNSVSVRKSLAAALIKTGQPDRALKTLNPLLTAKTQDPGALALAGEASMQANEPAKARDYLKMATAIDPKNAKLRTALGVSYMAAGDSAHGMAELESVAATGAGQNSADTLLISIHLRNREFDKAFAAINLLEKKTPNNPVVYSFRGATYAAKNDFVNARKNFDQVLILDPANNEAAMNLALLDLYEKNPQAARKRYEAILAKDKNNLAAMMGLVNLASDKKEAVILLERAVRANPSALQPRRLLAEHYLKNNEPQKAMGLAREAQTANPDSADVLSLLGATQLAVGETENALTTYDKLVKMTPKSPLAHYKLALVQAAAKNPGAAKSSLSKALELKPDYLEAQATLISLELGAGKPTEALKISQQMQKQNPKNSAGFVFEGDILINQKQYAQAIKAYEKAFSLDKKGMIAVKLHQAQSFAGNAKNADTHLLQWLKEHPKDIATRTYMAQIYMTRGQSKQAIEQYQVLLQGTPGNLLALNNLAWLYHREKDPRALDLAEQAYKLSPNAASITDTLGWILLEQGKSARAVELLQKAVSLAPANPEIGFHYAVALNKSGDKQKARKQLEAVLASGRSFPQQDEAKALLKQW